MRRNFIEIEKSDLRIQAFCGFQGHNIGLSFPIRHFSFMNKKVKRKKEIFFIFLKFLHTILHPKVYKKILG